MQANADLHIHSRFSMSVSKDMTVRNLARAAPLKGVHIIGSGDCLHGTWLDEVTALPEVAEGTYELDGTRFLLTCEVEGTHKVHHLLLFPSRSAVEEFRARVKGHSRNLSTDGRPNIRLGGEEIAQIAHDVDALFGPAHAFTPWTSMYSVHGSLEDCYGDMARHVTFVELGLSADADYADRIAELRPLTFLTCSDAHSPKPRRIAREFVRFELRDRTAEEVRMALLRRKGRRPVLNVGVPPDLGKYNESACIKCFKHYTLTEATMAGWRCKACKKRIKKGVWDRVNELSTSVEPSHPEHRPPYLHIVPLADIISDALGKGPDTKAVTTEWEGLIGAFRDEVSVLVDAPMKHVREVASPEVGRAIASFRSGKVVIYPGGGGEYGRIVVPAPGQVLRPPRKKEARTVSAEGRKGDKEEGKRKGKDEKKRGRRKGRNEGPHTGGQARLSDYG